MILEFENVLTKVALLGLLGLRLKKRLLLDKLHKFCEHEILKMSHDTILRVKLIYFNGMILLEEIILKTIGEKKYLNLILLTVTSKCQILFIPQNLINEGAENLNNFYHARLTIIQLLIRSSH